MVTSRLSVLSCCWRESACWPLPTAPRAQLYRDVSHLQVSILYTGITPWILLVATGTPSESSSLPQERTQGREGTGLLLGYLLDCYEGVNTETRRYGKREQLQYFSIMLDSCRSVIVSHTSLLLQGCFQYLLPEGSPVGRGIEELSGFLGLDRSDSIALLPSGFLAELVLHVYQVNISIRISIQYNTLYAIGRGSRGVQSNILSSVRETLECN